MLFILVQIQAGPPAFAGFASFGSDRKLRYSPYLKPRVVNGVRCLAVDMKLKDVNPEGYSQLLHFADENQLSIRDTEGNSISPT